MSSPPRYLTWLTSCVVAEHERSSLSIRAVAWPEIGPGDDLAMLLAETAALVVGDVVVVTSKVVSKAEGRIEKGSRAAVVDRESVRIVARRGESVIGETRHGLVMAAAGVDASNAPEGTVVLLPVDPDRSARRLRDRLHQQAGVNVAVLVTDTVGRAWRNGQIDLAIGCAGMTPWHELRGTLDTHGKPLTVTAPATVDEVASAADLVKGKTSGCPVAVVSGLGHLVHPAGQHGPGAAALIRDSALDMFGLGTREAAVAAALREDAVALAHFPPSTEMTDEPFVGLVSGLAGVRVISRPRVRTAGIDARNRGGWHVEVGVRDGAGVTEQRHAGALVERAKVLAVAYRLEVIDDAVTSGSDHGWETVHGFSAVSP